MYRTDRSTSLRNARTSTSRLRSLVVVAFGLTTRTARMGGTVPRLPTGIVAPVTIDSTRSPARCAPRCSCYVPRRWRWG
ncbi:hypothetical protein V2I01_07365 [Micromonospora sp. BRA006-A]|nr:hypothetical protein [Micromonospora sp. BRA006-A]